VLARSFVRELREQRRRVVVERIEALRVEVGEERAGPWQPAEREVAGNNAQRFTERGGTVDHGDVNSSGIRT
jgi:hypothetical protein